jgi:hypothetical protein
MLLGYGTEGRGTFELRSDNTLYFNFTYSYNWQQFLEMPNYSTEASIIFLSADRMILTLNDEETILVRDNSW